MTKRKLEQTYQSLLRFYGGHDKIPVDVFARQTGTEIKEARLLLDDLGSKDIDLESVYTIEASDVAGGELDKVIDTHVKTAEAKEIPIVKPKRKYTKKVEEPTQGGEGVFAVPFLKAFALPLSLTSMVLSTYFSYLFLQKQFSPILALAVSGVMVIFNVFCFEAGGLFLARKKIIWAFFFGILSLAVSVYSIGTTISGLYESYLVRVYNKQSTMQETNANRALYESYVAEEKEKQSLMEDKKVRLVVHQNALKELDTIEKQDANRKRYDTAYWGAWQLEKDIALISKEISELRLKQQEVLKKDSGITRDIAIDNKPDIYTWLAGIFKTNGDFVQFIMQAIPAVALDAIASFSLFLFLFLKKGSKQELKRTLKTKEKK